MSKESFIDWGTILFMAGAVTMQIALLCMIPSESKISKIIDERIALHFEIRGAGFNNE